MQKTSLVNGLYLVGHDVHCQLVTGLMDPLLPHLLETAAPGPCLSQPPGVSRNHPSENGTVLTLHPILYSSLKTRPYFYDHTSKFFLCSGHNSPGSRDSNSCNGIHQMLLHLPCDRASHNHSCTTPSLLSIRCSLPGAETVTQDLSHRLFSLLSVNSVSSLPGHMSGSLFFSSCQTDF